MGKKEFKIWPVITKDGLRYVVKEDKRWGGYVGDRNEDKYYLTHIKSFATKYKNINNAIETLDTMFGESYVINDNYL